MFQKLTKHVVKKLDPSKNMVPVKSIADNEHFRPLCLLIKKRKSERFYHAAPYYKQTGFTLDHVLLPEEKGKSIESLQQDFSQISLGKTRANQIEGDASIPLGLASIELKGSASLSKEFSIKSQKKSIQLESLEALRKERQINMDHSFIQQLQRTDINLYVVTEIIEASEETVYKESTKADGGLNVTYGKKLGAKGTRENNQYLVIPKGCTLAFRTIQLHITDGAWDLQHFDLAFTSRRLRVSIEEELGVGLQEVEYRCRIFSELSPDLQLIILNTIKAVMRDTNRLREFSQKMEEAPEENDGYELETESPELKDLFSTLQHSPRDLLLQLAEGITYVLDALHELMEDQLLLLLESLERKILFQQLKLVENLLENDWLKGEEPFCVDAGLLSYPHKEEQELTMALVELSGVQLQEDGSAVPMDQPFEAVGALFVAIYALHLMSGSSRTILVLPRDPLLKMLEYLRGRDRFLSQFHPC